MRPGGGRAKGNGFEREVARDIVATFRNQGITKEDCYRTPMSGGHRFARREDPGDLVVSPKLRELFPYVVECKRDRRFQLWHLLALERTWQKSWIEASFLDQTLREAEGTNRPPLLVVRKDREAAIAITTTTPLLPTTSSQLVFVYGGHIWLGTLWSVFLHTFAREKTQ